MTITASPPSTAIPQTTRFQGLWSAVQWQPDLAIPQKFLVGIVVAGQGEKAFLVMDEPMRLECFFKPALLANDFKLVMSLARSTLHEADLALGTPVFPSANLTASMARNIRGNSAKDLCEYLFSRMVMAAQPDTSRPTGFDSIDTRKVRTLVNQAIKKQAGMLFERIVREKSEFIDKHELDVNLLPTYGVGSVLSGWYKSPQSIMMNMLTASQDINAYAAGRNDKQSRAMFIMAPSANAQIPKKDLKLIDRTISEQEWKLERAGFTVVTRDNAEELAHDVLEWAHPLIQGS